MFKVTDTKGSRVQPGKAREKAQEKAAGDERITRRKGVGTTDRLGGGGKKKNREGLG